MTLRLLGVALGTLLSTTAFAASDLVTSVTGTSGVYVGSSGRYTVTVSNIGNNWAYGSTVSIQLPKTNTSPTVYVMGTVGTMSSGCTRSGTVVTCALGSIKKGTSKSVFVDLTLPYASAPLVITGTAATTSTENSTSNNEGSHTASLLTYTNSFSTPYNLSNDHCTGIGLSSYYECTLFPSSISGFDTTLNGDGSVTIVDGDPAYTGTWTQPASNRLQINYYELGVLVAAFDGYGVIGGCWEGKTTFPGSVYSAMYQVCPR
jgi:hypothetical protein